MDSNTSAHNQPDAVKNEPSPVSSIDLPQQETSTSTKPDTEIAEGEEKETVSMDIDSTTAPSTPLNNQEKEKEKESAKTESMNTDDPEDAGQEETDKNEENEENSAKSDVPLTRKDEEMLRKNKTLAEFLLLMDHYTPIIPDAVTDYYLGRTGFDCDDIRVKRLLALAAQKFIADIATDAFQYCKIRQQGNTAKKLGAKDKKTVLTMDDLSAALSEYGINIKKPEYFI